MQFVGPPACHAARVRYDSTRMSDPLLSTCAILHAAASNRVQPWTCVGMTTRGGADSGRQGPEEWGNLPGSAKLPLQIDVRLGVLRRSYAMQRSNCAAVRCPRHSRPRVVDMRCDSLTWTRCLLHCGAGGGREGKRLDSIGVMSSANRGWSSRAANPHVQPDLSSSQEPCPFRLWRSTVPAPNPPSLQTSPDNSPLTSATRSMLS
ncbi:hypothetical protein T440DRAFT_181826 [Plenodomus tracheiphilus IPT5]|uniref:Uncharacterized protein n=1 Tax=Plenodomus tracheiphilus IPT5 TaxID=1408161 RepID=A0A6A7B0T1_9PLEO|nr:hypothetical protein T440DRAFT_181826 [Plenodomus tracheiphilus IPT5]